MSCPLSWGHVGNGCVQDDDVPEAGHIEVALHLGQPDAQGVFSLASSLLGRLRLVGDVPVSHLDGRGRMKEERRSGELETHNGRQWVTMGDNVGFWEFSKEYLRLQVRGGGVTGGHNLVRNGALGYFEVGRQ